MNALYLYRHLNIHVLSQENMYFLADQGETTLLLDSSVTGNYIGLVPLSVPVKLTTTGLKWDLGK